MKLSEYIEKLEAILKENGDLRVTKYEPVGMGVNTAQTPVVKKIRERRPREQKAYYSYQDADKIVETVCHI